MIEHHQEWNAGDLGCGELVLGVHKRLRAHPGKVLKLTALDTAAAIDLQAFCAMTHDELLAVDAQTNNFWLRARKK